MAKIYNLRRTSTLALRQRKAALLRRLAIAPDFLRASYVERFTTCGKANCACARGQKHGPFYYLASGLVPGRVLKFLLKTPVQQHDGQQGSPLISDFGQAWKNCPRSTPNCCAGAKLSPVNSADFNQLSRFVAYTQKRFDLPLLAGCFADARPQPDIPSHAIALSLVLGEVARIPSLLQLQAETQLPQWQRWVGYRQEISHDTFGYVSERMDPAQLRRAAIWINRQLKRGKAFEANKIHGLLAVSLDANEQFCSDHRCCADCLSREVTCKDGQGREFKKTQYYHKQVYAQLSGPELSVILDFEPRRPGEEECAAALRLLRRMRQKYGARFFDAVVVDSWYTNGPFLKTVVEELGWPVIAALKQERYEAYPETLALTRGQKPAQVVERDGRQVEIWEVPAVRLTDTYAGPVRIVRVREQWTQRQRVGPEWQREPKEQNWIWVVAGDLDVYDGAAIRDLGHSRWRIENHAFGELTQHWHLTHCAHHHPVAVVALLWIKIIALTLFGAFAVLHGKLFRLGKATLNEVRKQIYRSLLCSTPMLLFSG